jgi:hypothetical protein
VPLREKVLEALDGHPRRIGTRLVFPAHHEDDYLKLSTFSQIHRTPGLRAAGVAHRGVYACRHTFAAWSIAAGVQLFYLSRIMGTSITQIDATYGHLVPDSEEYCAGCSMHTTSATVTLRKRRSNGDVLSGLAVRRSDWLTGTTRRGILVVHTGSSEGEMQMTRILRRASTAVMSLLLVAMVAAFALPAAAAPAEVIVLPGATSAEGIANGGGTTFYAGDLFAGDIFRGDVHRGTAQLFIDAPAGRMAVGMVVDLEHDLLFVAGGFTGQGYVYDTRTGATVAIYQFGTPGTAMIPSTAMINDVVLTKDGAWFTDSFQPMLYFVPVSEAGVPGSFVTLELTGPAAEISGDFNLNGIQATPNGKTLIVAHSANGELYTVDPVSGASATIAGVSVPSVDGIVLLGRQLWAVQNSNQVSRVQLSPHLTSGRVEEIITSDLFQVPSTAARFGSRLGVINAKFDTGFPPTADEWGVVLVDR